MKLEKLTPGMVVYDVHSTRMGNTTMTSLGTWTVKIVSVDQEARSCVASWNGNRPQTFYEGTVKKWTEQKPFLVRTAMGGYRRPTRDELATHRAKAQP